MPPRPIVIAEVIAVAALACAACSRAGAPEARAPSATAPSATASSATAPSGAAPSATAPAPSASSASASSRGASAATAPSASAPTATPPSAKRPTAPAQRAPPLPPGLTSACWLQPIPSLGYAENPCELTADLDGDGGPDHAQLVAESDGKKRRGVFVRFSSGAAARAGAGKVTGNGGNDFEWMDAWQVLSSAERPAFARGACLLVEKTEAASASLCWDGDQLRWTQRGD